MSPTSLVNIGDYNKEDIYRILTNASLFNLPHVRASALRQLSTACVDVSSDSPMLPQAAPPKENR